MATLEEQRRAIAAGMAARRAPTSEAERKAIGKRMIEERTGKSVAADLNRLAAPQQQRRSLPSISPVGSVPASVGRGSYVAPAAAATAGIASPLTEPSYAAREYWPGGDYSTDGLLVIPATKKMVLADADGAEVIINLAQPV